jgi:hypothetical protein
MSGSDTLPQLDECLDAYFTAYEQFGTEQFDPAALSRLTDRGTESVLKLAVAYGLFEYDGSAYRVTVEPDAPVEQWTAAATSRATAIHRRIGNWDTGDRVEQSAHTAEGERLHRNGRDYASVFVDQKDEVEAVAERARTVVTTAEVDGVVLRSSGELANDVQQFADTLCAPDGGVDSAPDITFQKDDSDVEGDHKDELEFMLYLSHE